MLFLAVAMTISVLIAVAVVVYVAYPHRGERLPVAPWLGEAMGKAVDSMPTQDDPADFYESASAHSRR